jgi:hypothetical protein
MKNILCVCLLLLGTAAYAGKPKSTGKDLVCFGHANIATPFFHCDTAYGPSDRCTDSSASFQFSLNTVRGDLSSGVSGNLQVIGIAEQDGNSQLLQKLKSLVQETSGLVSYNDGIISLRMTTPLGQNEVSAKRDYSAGLKTQGVYVTLPNSDAYGDVSIEDLGLVVGITIFCDSGNGYNN